MRLAYVVVPTAVYFGLRYHALDGVLFQTPAVSKTVNVLVDAPLWQHGLGVFQLWGMYWAKMLWPDVLSVDYSINAIRLATSVVDAQFLLGVLVAAGLGAVSIVNWRRGRRSWAVLTAALVVAYGPTANALVLIQVFFAERIWYLPSIWACMAVAMAIVPLLRRPMAYAVVGLVLVGMTARCWIRNVEWRDNATLYAAAYRDYPDAVGAQVHHAQMLVERGDYAGGITVLRKALNIDMGFTDAQRVITQAYLLAGDEVSALRHAQIAEMQVPGHRPTLQALAFLRQRAEVRSGDELAALRGIAEADPHDVAAELRVVVGLREIAMLEEAMVRLASGEERFANEAAWHYEYAVTLVYANEQSAAIDRYDRAIRLEPDHPPWLVERAMLLLERRKGNDLERAWALAARAAALEPDAAYVLVCQAELSANRGDLEAAREYYRRAIESTPPGDERRRAFEQRVRILGG